MAPIYDLHRASSVQITLNFILIASLLAGTLYLTIFFVAPPTGTAPPRSSHLSSSVVPFFPSFGDFFNIRKFTLPKYLINTLIVGAGKAGCRSQKSSEGSIHLHFRSPVFIDDDPEKIGKEFFGYPVLGDSNSFYKIVEEYQIGQ
jgi:FlaA1/EpsC-like NDP-sugar epimerase